MKFPGISGSGPPKREMTLPSGSMFGAEARPPDYDHMYIIDSGLGPWPTVAEASRARGTTPVDTIIELALETDFQQLFVQADTLTPLDDASLLTLLRHPRTVMAGSDVGAHVGQVMDADFPTVLLGVGSASGKNSRGNRRSGC